jgi:GxxExxY protein
MNENEIGTIVVDSAVNLHKELGPGLLETVYEVLLTHVLRQKGLGVARQVPVPITYNGTSFDEAFRADMVVAGKVILELKCVEKLSNAHKKQLLTYLKLTGTKLGYVLNFGEPLMKNGICRTPNDYWEGRFPGAPKQQDTSQE